MQEKQNDEIYFGWAVECCLVFKLLFIQTDLDTEMYTGWLQQTTRRERRAVSETKSAANSVDRKFTTENLKHITLAQHTKWTTTAKKTVKEPNSLNHNTAPTHPLRVCKDSNSIQYVRTYRRYRGVDGEKFCSRNDIEAKFQHCTIHNPVVLINYFLAGSCRKSGIHKYTHTKVYECYIVYLSVLGERKTFSIWER